MSRPADPSTRAAPPPSPMGAALIALMPAGCGGTSAAVSHAVSAAAARRAPPPVYRSRLMRSWCPQAIVEGGRRLTEARARGCLRQAWDAWLRELRRNGYHPSRVGR